GEGALATQTIDREILEPPLLQRDPGRSMPHELHEHSEAEEPVESDTDTSAGLGRRSAGQGTAYGGGIYEDFGQVFVIIADMTKQIKSELSGTLLRSCRHGCPRYPRRASRNPPPGSRPPGSRARPRCRRRRDRAASGPRA